jgi:hypothetical protein
MAELQMAEQITLSLSLHTLTHTHTHTHTYTHTCTHTFSGFQDDDTSPAPEELKAHPAPEHELLVAEQLLGQCHRRRIHACHRRRIHACQDDSTALAGTEPKTKMGVHTITHTEHPAPENAFAECLASTSSWLLEVQQLQPLLQQQGSEDWAEVDQIHSLMLESNEVVGVVSPPARSLYLSIDGMQGFTSHIGVTQACSIITSVSGTSCEACHVI